MSLNRCSQFMCDVGIHLVVSLQMESSLGEYFCTRTKFYSYSFKKRLGAPWGPAVLTVKNRLEVGPFSLMCQMFAAFRAS